MNLPTSVRIVEVGPRDGLQIEPVTVPTEGKVALLNALVDSGIRFFEATAFVSPQWIPQLADASEVMNRLERRPDVTWAALIPNERGYQRAAAAGLKEVVLVISATEGHSRANLNRTVDEAIAGVSPIVERGKEDGIHVRVSVSTVFGCPFDGVPSLEQVLTVVDRVAAAGVDEMTLCDTIGVANPRQVYDVFSCVLEHRPDLTVNAHFHDTRGLGLANIVAAMDAGITTFDSSIGGLGGCPFAPGAAGNVATEDVVYMLQEMGIETGVNLDRLLDAADRIAELTGHPVRSRIDRALREVPHVAPAAV